MSGAVLLATSWVLAFGMLALLLAAMVRSIRDERTPGRGVWREFGLSLVLVVLFLAAWSGQAVGEWQVYTDEQRSHGESVELGDFVAHFGQSTLENWQSEFLQLFAFVTLAALFIHKGSAESKDGGEELAAALRRIEGHLGTLPDPAPGDAGRDWDLPETALEAHDRRLARRSS